MATSAPAPPARTSTRDSIEGLDSGSALGLGGLDHRIGMLFGALGAATIAGPSALDLVGNRVGDRVILALIHAELGGPVPGDRRHQPASRTTRSAASPARRFGWASYLQAASVAPIEVLAAIQYAGSYSWGKNFVNKSNELHNVGLIIAVALMSCSWRST